MKYGEPWEVKGDKISMNRGESTGDPHLHRIVQCVNACAGIEEPAVLAKEDMDELILLIDNLRYAQFASKKQKFYRKIMDLIRKGL